MVVKHTSFLTSGAGPLKAKASVRVSLSIGYGMGPISLLLIKGTSALTPGTPLSLLAAAALTNCFTVLER